MKTSTIRECKGRLIGAAVLVGLTAACGSDGDGGAAEAGGGTDGSGAGSSGGDSAGVGGSGAGGAGGNGAGGDAAGGNDCPPPDNDAPPPAPVVDQISGVTVDTLAGSADAGVSDGTGTAASFDNPVNLVVSPSGDLTVAGFEQGFIRTITPSGEVETAFASQAGFSRPFGLAYSEGGTLYVGTDTNTDGNNADGLGSLWTVDTTVGSASLVMEAIGRPRGLVFRGSSLVLSHPPHHALVVYDPEGGSMDDLAGAWNCPGYEDGEGSEARFYIPYDVDLMPNGDVVIADAGNHAIRRITPEGVVSTIAGTGQPGMVDGSLEQAHFQAPRALAVSDDGLIYVSDLGNHRIRRVDVDGGLVQTVAGDGTPGFANGTGGDARFYGQEGMDVSDDGQTLYVADGTEGKVGEPFNRVRVISLP